MRLTDGLFLPIVRNTAPPKLDSTLLSTQQMIDVVVKANPERLSV